MPSFSPGAHTLTVYSMLPGDADLSNDTTHKQVSRIIPVTIPYTMGFEPSENLEGWKIVDANNDGYTWFLAATGGNTAPHCMEYSYNTSAAANDWFITTCIDLESSKTYQLAFYYKAQSATFPEKVKVMYGTDNDPAALTSQIVDLNNITTVTYTQSTSTFTVPATGTYYLGWKCYSAADMYNLFVDDIAITEYTGIEDNNGKITLGVYPNPARDQVTIISAEEDAVISITNSFGSLVFSAAMSTSVLYVNTSGFGSGLYFVKVQSAKGASVQKLIINR